MTEQARMFDDVVLGRRALRAFLPEPLPAATLERIFSVAQRAPSNCNTQPWITHVASGATLATLREELPARFIRGEMTLDFPYDGVYHGVYKERQYGSAQALYVAAGIAREDKTGRQEQFMRNFTFFDAPHAAFLFLPEPFGLREAADLGIYAQTLMLTMTANGLGSCPQTALSFEADVIRELLGVDAGNKLLFGISFGVPDMDAPVNRCATDRAQLADCVYFHS
jgi:nitroreductase